MPGVREWPLVGAVRCRVVSAIHIAAGLLALALLVYLFVALFDPERFQ